MATHDFVRFNKVQQNAAQSADQLHRSEGRVPSYRQPALTLVGAVTRLVQGQPVGNRADVYDRWCDR